MSVLTEKLKGNWNVIKGKSKQEFANITDDDQTYEGGQEEEFLGRLQRKTGESKVKLKSFIDNI
ncbi:MAG: CsbD family protein [Saprospiraceae bacterium]|nr:CsbD family protein [Saprospiraceae bacterium]